MLLVSKKKSGGNHASSYIALYFKAFLQILLINYLRKMLGYPQFSFRMSITLVKICFPRIFSKSHKNTFELVGTVLKPHINVEQVSFVTLPCVEFSFEPKSTEDLSFVEFLRFDIAEAVRQKEIE